MTLAAGVNVALELHRLTGDEDLLRAALAALIRGPAAAGPVAQRDLKPGKSTARRRSRSDGGRAATNRPDAGGNPATCEEPEAESTRLCRQIEERVGGGLQGIAAAVGARPNNVAAWVAGRASPQALVRLGNTLASLKDAATKPLMRRPGAGREEDAGEEPAPQPARRAS